MGAILEVRDLCVAYGALIALSNVSWNVAPGEILGIIGPNGAGKSTCYDATTNLVMRSGRVILCGEDVSTMPPYRLAARGLKRAFQQNAFFHELSILDNMRMVLHDRHGVNLVRSVLLPFSAARRRRRTTEEAAATLERFGIGQEYHQLKPPGTSYGTQRLLSICTRIWQWRSRAAA